MLFDPRPIQQELNAARREGRRMLDGVGDILGGHLTEESFAFMGFVERAQAFHQGVVDMVERGNPLAAATLLRSFAENAATVFYLEKSPGQIEKLKLGATQGLPIGKVIAAAEKALPGLKGVYDRLSSMAHPSGAGSFNTIKLDERTEGSFFWQSAPTFKTLEDAQQLLTWLKVFRDITAQAMAATAASVAASDESAGVERGP